jgi:hypothetical protein
MSDTRLQIPVKGSVFFINTVVDMVEIWIQSPTGDSTDSYIYRIRCSSEAQAQAVAKLWKAVWGL